jgi:hypothetical protein
MRATRARMKIVAVARLMVEALGCLGDVREETGDLQRGTGLADGTTAQQEN